MDSKPAPAAPVDLALLSRQATPNTTPPGVLVSVRADHLATLVKCARALWRIKDTPLISERERWQIAFDALRDVTDTAGPGGKR